MKYLSSENSKIYWTSNKYYTLLNHTVTCDISYMKNKKKFLSEQMPYIENVQNKNARETII